MGGRAHGYKEITMNTNTNNNTVNNNNESLDLNMEDLFVDGDKLQDAEKDIEEKTNEILMTYNRFLYSENPDTIAELVVNVFELAQSIDPQNIFYEATEDRIKWSTQALSANMSQFVLVEGLLTHRFKAGLLVNVFENEMGTTVKVLPANSDILKGTAYLGGLKDMKQVNHIVENVIQVANIPTEGPNSQMTVVQEPLNPAMPQMTGYCIVLFGLEPQQMSNLKRASKVKKASEKMSKFVSNASTAGYATTKAALDGIVTPGMDLATKMGGLVIGSVATGAAKSGMTFVGELTGALVQADLPHCEQLNTIKSNCAKLAMQYGRGNKNDSFSFEF